MAKTILSFAPYTFDDKTVQFGSSSLLPLLCRSSISALPMSAQQPKKPMGAAYGQFLADKRSEFTKAYADSVYENDHKDVGIQNSRQREVSAITKMAGEAWRKLSPEEKKPYQDRYETVRAEYYEDKQAFLESGGVIEKSGKAKRACKRKAKQDPQYVAKMAKRNDPNRPRMFRGGAYGCFVTKFRSDFQAQCAGKPAWAVAKLAAEKWKALSDAEKQPFEEEYKAQKVLYEKAMESYVHRLSVASLADNDDGDAEEE